MTYRKREAESRSREASRESEKSRGVNTVSMSEEGRVTTPHEQSLSPIVGRATVYPELCAQSMESGQVASICQNISNGKFKIYVFHCI